jgi:hypothetical protein
MKSIYEILKELENASIQRSKEAKEAGESTEWEDGFQEAIIEIESWIDANRHVLEDDCGNLYTIVNADTE